jgi:hypothetical protein
MSIISKIGNANLLIQNPHTISSVPETRLLTFSALRSMIQRHPSVYLKPNDCCHGKGMIRVDRLSRGIYRMRVRDTTSVTYHPDLYQIWKRYRQSKINRIYLVQQGIHSLTLKGKPFDIRAHLLRVGGKWNVAGLVGRIVDKGFVTNRHSGGQPRHIDALLTHDLGLSPSAKVTTIHKLNRLAAQSAQAVSRAYPKWCELGVDLGIDVNRRIWVYEVNITPGFVSFAQVDPLAWQRIRSWRLIAN